MIWAAHYDDEGVGLGEMTIHYLPAVNNAAARVAMHMMIPFTSPEVDRSYLVIDGLRVGEMFESVPVLYVVQLTALDQGGLMTHYTVDLGGEPELSAVWVPLLGQAMSMVLDMRTELVGLSFQDALGHANGGRKLYGH
jgi:hypothetical protein